MAAILTHNRRTLQQFVWGAWPSSVRRAVPGDIHRRMPRHAHRSRRARLLVPIMFGIAVFTALGTTAVGTAVAPTRLTLAGTIATQTPSPVGSSPEPGVPEQAAAPAVIPDAAVALPG